MGVDDRDNMTQRKEYNVGEGEGFAPVRGNMETQGPWSGAAGAR